jgi:small subunit ribosomal protein S12
MTPRKPNSARRRIARVRLRTGKLVFAYIQGETHNLLEYSTVLLRGGRANDLPGLKYKMVFGKFDFSPPQGRKSRRSKYGLKKPRISID